MPVAGQPWTAEEIEATIDSYFAMLEDFRAHRPYVKREVYEALRAGPLAVRSRQAIELKMMNISAVLDEVGLPWLKGYVPRHNYQEALRVSVVNRLEDNGVLEPDVSEATSDSEELDERVGALLRAGGVGGTSGTVKGNRKPKKTLRSTTAYERCPRVKALVLSHAKGVCECCGNPGPFHRTGSEWAFLEVHHVRRLADGGPDTPQNAIAVCPNCHRMLHLASQELRAKALASVVDKVERLQRS